jgi:hypothetical protein
MSAVNDRSTANALPPRRLVAPRREPPRASPTAVPLPGSEPRGCGHRGGAHLALLKKRSTRTARVREPREVGHHLPARPATARGASDRGGLAPRDAPWNGASRARPLRHRPAPGGGASTARDDGSAARVARVPIAAAGARPARCCPTAPARAAAGIGRAARDWRGAHPGREAGSKLPRGAPSGADDRRHLPGEVCAPRERTSFATEADRADPAASPENARPDLGPRPRGATAASGTAPISRTRLTMRASPPRSAANPQHAHCAIS